MSIGRVGQVNLDLKELRERLRKMTDNALRKFGRDTIRMRSPQPNFKNRPNTDCVIQLDEAHAEWRRGHLKRVK